MNHGTIASSQAHRLVIPSLAMSPDDSLPTDLASAHALIIAQREALSAAEAASRGGGERSAIPGAVDREAEVHDQEAQHERFGQSSERGALLDQLELQLADLEEDAAQAERRRRWQPRRQARR